MSSRIYSAISLGQRNQASGCRDAKEVSVGCRNPSPNAEESGMTSQGCHRILVTIQIIVVSKALGVLTIIKLRAIVHFLNVNQTYR